MYVGCLILYLYDGFIFIFNQFIKDIDRVMKWQFYLKCICILDIYVYVIFKYVNISNCKRVLESLVLLKIDIRYIIFFLNFLFGLKMLIFR